MNSFNVLKFPDIIYTMLQNQSMSAFKIRNTIHDNIDKTRVLNRKSNMNISFRKLAHKRIPNYIFLID